MKNLITDRAWWHAAIARAARTALAVLTGAISLLVGADAVTVGVVLSTIALSVVVSLATSLAGLPEIDGREVTWWHATVTRVAKTFGQVLLTATASAALWSEIDWPAVLAQAALAALVTFLLSLKAALPEVPEPS